MRRALLTLSMLLCLAAPAAAHGPVAMGFSGGGGGGGGGAAVTCWTAACAQVQDSSGNGDIAPEFQAAINAVLWPAGTLTTASDVYLVAPKQGTYNLAAKVVICGDTSPPSGSTAPDCTGSTQQLPRIHFVGAWSNANLRCTMANENPGVNTMTPCVRIGDAWADGGDFTKNVPLAFDSPLVLRETVDLVSFTYASVALWCDGCTGELKLDLGTTSGMVAPGPMAVIAGAFLHTDITALNPVTSGRVVMLDGDQRDSTITVNAENLTLQVGSYGASGFGVWGPADGCSYNGFTGLCDNLHVLPETSIFGTPASDALIWLNGGDGIVVEGTYRSASTAKPTVEVTTYDATRTFRLVTFRGTCFLPAGTSNNCIRLLGGYSPAWKPTFVMDGRFESALATMDINKGGVGCLAAGSGGTVKLNTHILVGANASGRNTAGGYAGVLDGSNIALIGRESCDASGANGDSRTVRIPSQTLGASPPYCADLKDGTWRSCSDERTKLRKPTWPSYWTYRGATTIYGNAAATTSCNVRVMRNGTDPAGDEADNGVGGSYYPGGFPFRVGADGLRTSGQSVSYNVANPAVAADYWQVQVDDDYSNVGGQEGCLTTVASGFATSNGTTTTLNDNTKSWTTNEHSAAGRRIVLDAGSGALATRTISSNTATQVTVGSAFPAATWGTGTYYNTKYRIVAGSGSCSCASEPLPEMDVALDLFQVSQ